MNQEESNFIQQQLSINGITDPAYTTLIGKLVREIRSSGVRTLGIAGSQGSGKSTIARILKGLFEQESRYQVALLSLDDYYKTREERLAMQQTHPLFAVRGVPGTHDTAAMLAAKTALLAGEEAVLPKFDKGLDDRVGTEVLPSGTNLLILEGWCFGASPEPANRLERAVNALEADEDPLGLWRREVNRHLANEAYQSLFAVDYFLFFKAPSIDAILDWRLQQEQTVNQGPRSMSKSALQRFISHYQRITEWMLIDVPSRANVVVELNADHTIANVIERNDSA